MESFRRTTVPLYKRIVEYEIKTNKLNEEITKIQAQLESDVLEKDEERELRNILRGHKQKILQIQYESAKTENIIRVLNRKEN